MKRSLILLTVLALFGVVGTAVAADAPIRGTDQAVVERAPRWA